MPTKETLILKLVLDAWNGQLSRADKFFTAHTDEQLQQEIAPGKNSGVYLLGHISAVHDAMFPLFGIGEKLFPELEIIFIKNPDKSGIEKPAVEQLRKCWKEVNEKLSQKLNAFSVDEWLQKHTAVSEEDFKKEPHRNRLNVLISRTNHLAYHLGQLVLMK
jgi:hypothetical protein